MSYCIHELLYPHGRKLISLPEKYNMKRLCFFHEMLNHPYEMYHEIHSWYSMGCFMGHEMRLQIIMVNSWNCRDFMGAVPMKR